MRSTLPPLSAARFFTTWHFDPWVAGVTVSLVVLYLAGVRRARRGAGWPTWRAWSFVVLGAGSLVFATMSSLGVYDRALLWPAAVQITMLLTVTPLCLGLGDPIRLAIQTLPGRGGAWVEAVLHSPPIRVLTFPPVGAVLATLTQFGIFFSGYLGAAMRSETVLHLLQLQVVVTGCLFAMPLLGVELLPSWCTQPIRMAFAGLDGLLDAVPGIAVLSASGPITQFYVHAHPAWAGTVVHDQWIAGGLMITVSELIALPFVAVLFRAWIKEDARAAAAVDRRLDANAARARRLGASPADRAGVVDDPTRPWWEVDPGPLADRAERYGWRHRQD